MYKRKYVDQWKRIDHRAEKSSRGVPQMIYGTLVEHQHSLRMDVRYYKITGAGKIIIFADYRENAPVFDNNGNIKGFKYFYVTRYLDIINENSALTPEQIAHDFWEEAVMDPAKYSSL
jgi:hypothetical protein